MMGLKQKWNKFWCKVLGHDVPAIDMLFFEIELHADILTMQGDKVLSKRKGTPELVCRRCGFKIVKEEHYKMPGAREALEKHFPRQTGAE